MSGQKAQRAVSRPAHEEPDLSAAFRTLARATHETQREILTAGVAKVSRTGDSPLPEAVQEWIAQRRANQPAADREPATEEWRDLAAALASDAGAPRGEPAQARWEREPVDRAWTAQTTSDLQTALRDLAIEGDILDVGCRESLCRVQMIFDSIEDAHAFSDGAGQPERREQLRFMLKGGAIQVEAFLSRQTTGAAPPSPAKAGPPPDHAR